MLPQNIRSPVAGEPDGGWLKKANLVGVNLRTVGGFLGFDPLQPDASCRADPIHLLPIWEPGVVGSLYGMVSWQLNPEFFSPALAEPVPWLDTRQAAASGD